MSEQELKEAILMHSNRSKRLCDFDRARWLLLQLQDKQKAESYLRELGHEERLHEQKDGYFEMESAKSERRGDWGKARSWLRLMENKMKSGRLVEALEKKKTIQGKHNRGVQEDVVTALFVDRDWVKACSLVSEMIGNIPKSFASLSECNEALVRGDFHGARRVLDVHPSPLRGALRPLVDLAEAIHNDDQERVTSISLFLDTYSDQSQRIFLHPSNGASSEKCDDHFGAVGSLPSQIDNSTHLEAQIREAELRGDWSQAMDLLLRIPEKTTYRRLLRRLNAGRSAQNEIDEDLERQAKKAELNGDWAKARSFLSRIKGDFGEFPLAALAYSEARLNRNDEHVQLLVELQRKYPDPRLIQVELDHFLQFLEHAELNGPPARAEVLRNSFVFQRMVETGIIWNKPHDFRKVFEMMAEDIRDAHDRLWYKLPHRNPRYRTHLRILTQKGDMVEELHI